MSYNLILNSKNAIAPNVFQFNFINGSFTIPEDSEMAVAQITLPYSWVNISSTYGNNTFQYIMPTTGSTTVTRTVTLPNGFYGISDINNALWADMKSQGYYFYNNSISTITPSTGSTSYPTILYPISFSTNTNLYTNQISFQYIPTSGANVINQYGTNWTWALGTYPTTASTPQIVITGTVTSTSNLFGNYLGFTNGTYPSSAQTYSGAPTVTNSLPFTVNGNSLLASPAFAPKGSTVNGVMIRCSLVDNPVSPTFTDVLDNMPITSTYGSNINYLPISDNWIRLRPGKFSSFTITFNDDNFNVLNMIDQNVLISLLIRFPSNNKK
jgi:hypothetical protein